MESQLARGERLRWMARHLLGLFRGRDGARQWRRTLIEGANRPGAGIETIEEALRHVVP